MSDRESWMQFIREEYDPRPNLGLASYVAFDSEWDDGAGRIADAILADKSLLLRDHAQKAGRIESIWEDARIRHNVHKDYPELARAIELLLMKP